MGLQCQIDLKSDWGFPNRTPELGLFIDYTEAIAVFTNTFMEVSRELVPVDTGFLQSSLNCFNNGMTIEAEATAEYAQYVEYGTWCCPAQPYFNPAIESASNASFIVAKKIYEQAIAQESQMVQQQYMEEAERRVERVCMSMGGQTFIQGMLLAVLLSLMFLFIELFSSLFSYDEEE